MIYSFHMLEHHGDFSYLSIHISLHAFNFYYPIFIKGNDATEVDETIALLVISISNSHQAEEGRILGVAWVVGGEEVSPDGRTYQLGQNYDVPVRLVHLHHAGSESINKPYLNICGNVKL